ncbi:Arylsulfatase [Pontiella desulfatans]|uniref:Arylsulfatase n=1 Tax=Pontiella desulfatans TaxID=2750659 RepID=A0A6C2UC29_PONDE|nr:sulfatase-like hydrolase/transferase [Pontiella desulfatans]SPS74103.1 sulfatase S1_14,S1_15 [Kiritimatiellales bacterium]VGO17732.1 Arylsulfatase [Pontiella desulfatans]
MKCVCRWLVSGLIFSCSVAFAVEQRPNVLVVFADDLGYGDVGCYGATKLKTPHIDRIAKSGMRFTNAYTPTSTCSQSRVSLLTGRYWWRSPLHPIRGVIAPAGPNALLEKGVESLPKFFQQNGYRTAAFGKWHVGVGYGDSPAERYDWNRPTIEGGPLASGFDYFFGLAANVENEPAFYIENDTFVGRGPNDAITIKGKKVTPWTPEVLYEDDEVGQDTARKAVEYIESAPTDKPLFVYFASTVPHKPITPAKEFIGSSDCGIYGDFVQELDWQVGELIDALRKTGRLDNTMIIFTSDNGAVVATDEEFAKKWHLEPMWETYAAGHLSNGELRDGKHAVYEGGSRVPFIVSWPKHIPAGKQNEGLFCLTDVFATFADLFEAPVPESAIDSVSFWPVWSGKSTASPREVVPGRTSNSIFSIRRGKWKYIEHDPKNKTPRQRENKDQLYDLENDPGEQNNVFGQYPEVAARLKKELGKVKSAPGKAKPEGNLLPEGNFDSMKGSQLSPEWQLKTFKKGGDIGSASVEAVLDNGNLCLKFTCEGGKWSLMSRGVDASEGTTYTLTLRAKALNHPTQATLYLVSPWEFVEQKTATVPTEWQTYTMSVTPDKLGKGNNLLLRVDQEGAGSILIDDIKLTTKVK